MLLLTVAIPFAGGLAGAQPETRELSLVSVFAVHAILLFFLACYYALSGRHSLSEFLKLRSPQPARDLAVRRRHRRRRLDPDDPHRDGHRARIWYIVSKGSSPAADTRQRGPSRR